MRNLKCVMKRVSMVLMLTLVVVFVGASAKVQAANTIAAKYYVLKNIYERPSELPITSNPQNHYSYGIPGSVLLSNPSNGEPAAYLSYLHGYVGDVTKFLVDVPTDEELEQLVPYYDPDIHYIQWYVIKGESEGINVDGVVVMKSDDTPVSDIDGPEPEETVFDDTEEEEETVVSEPETVNIGDEDSPLTGGHFQGDRCYIHWIVLLMVGLYVIYEVIAFFFRKKSK